MWTAPGVAVRPLTSGPSQHFFGYFDKSPWGPPGQRQQFVLAHETQLSHQLPQPGDSVRVGFVDLKDVGAFVPLAESKAWNFQQGAMLQWLPHAKSTVVYNDRAEQKAHAVILEVEAGRSRHLSGPVAAVSPDGKTALSINFGRLNEVRPDYGYAGVEDRFADQRCPDGDGIWRLDLESGNSKLLLSLPQIAAMGVHGDAPGAKHWVNHPLFNRDGSRFCFLHRYRTRSGTIFTRLLSCRPEASDLRVLIEGMASHFCWRNGDDLVGWVGERRGLQSSAGALHWLPIGAVLRRVYRALGSPRTLKHRLLNDRFVEFRHTDRSNSTIGAGVLKTDGHCSFSPNGDWLLTDTYPDSAQESSLLLYHSSTNTVTEIARFKTPSEMQGPSRCDLHPRWNKDGTRICVDSADDGSRQLYELSLLPQFFERRGVEYPKGGCVPAR